ncbi:MAG: amino acid permease, partial [Candidatus Cloacimonetes bacterium]|nr:amino acid permease [Candidatus Cloacimonadota bacterium]
MRKLKRELQLIDVFSIAAGAMISSGLFILPGLAYAKSGSMVIVAYLLAGFLVIPSVFSKAELATAMPKSGGAYFFIERSMGAGLGTLSGISAWFSLAFKSAFALLGIGAFATILFPEISMLQIKLIAIFFCLLFMVTNLIGTKHSSRLQTWLVGSLIVILFFYIFNGMSAIKLENFSSKIDFDAKIIFMTAGLIFISYGGLTKIASVAEEVENPSRNLPLGMFLAFVIVTIIYVFTVFVTVGVLGDKLASSQTNFSLTPISDSAEVFLGSWGKVTLAIAALLAFISTANAGILAASRNPMAMSRDRLLPRFFNSVNDRFKTPHNSIIFTSIFIIIVLFLPLEILVKTASTIMILLFIFVNLSLIIMRESGLQNYRPKFRSPLYPWVQIFAIIAYGFIIVQMGKIPLIIAGTFLFSSMIWYLLYGKIRANKDSALLHLIRKIKDKELVSNTLETELKEIIWERDNIKKDRFDEIIEKCTILDIKEKINLDEFFKIVAAKMENSLEMKAEVIYERLIEREKESTTVLTNNLAIPHIILDGEKEFDIL